MTADNAVNHSACEADSQDDYDEKDEHLSRSMIHGI